MSRNFVELLQSHVLTIPFAAPPEFDAISVNNSTSINERDCPPGRCRRPFFFVVDGLMFSCSSTLSLNVDNFRFFSITFSLIAIIFVGANFIPSLWDIFQFIGATTGICIGFIFPVAITLRDKHNLATKSDKILSVFLIVISVTSSVVAIYNNVCALINKN